MRIIKIKNNQASLDTYCGQDIDAGGYYTIQSETERENFANDSKVQNHMSDPTIKLIINDGVDDLSYLEGKKWLEGTYNQNVDVTSQNPFAAKTLPNGTKLYRRKHGFSMTVPANSNYVKTLTVPYSLVKINEMELVNCSIGDSVDFSVYDTVDGLYQQSLGVPPESVNPDLLLNQFGFGINLPEGFYRDISQYDAELFGTMRIKINYENSTSSEVIIRGNIIYHEIV